MMKSEASEPVNDAAAVTSEPMMVFAVPPSKLIHDPRARAMSSARRTNLVLPVDVETVALMLTDAVSVADDTAGKGLLPGDRLGRPGVHQRAGGTVRPGQSGVDVRVGLGEVD